MITLQAVQEKDRELLWNINQKYLYEMTNFYDNPMDENGNYHYGHFDEYFTDPRRTAYFIYNDDALIGFAFLCPYSNIGQEPDYPASFGRNPGSLQDVCRIFSFAEKDLTDIINMTYSCHVGSAMICAECEREALPRNEDRQADRDIVNLTAGRKDNSSRTGGKVRGIPQDDKPGY